jgi:hypothetical protein
VSLFGRTLKEKLFQPSLELHRAARLAFPNYQDTPALPAKGTHDRAIALYVILKLLHPERLIRFGFVRESAPRMAMPEAAVD